MIMEIRWVLSPSPFHMHLGMQMMASPMRLVAFGACISAQRAVHLSLTVYIGASCAGTWCLVSGACPEGCFASCAWSRGSETTTVE